MYRHQRHFYDATRKFYLLGRDQLIADLKPPAGGRVLEIGCGTGRNLVKAARAYPAIRAYGIDVSAEMLAHRAPRDRACRGFRGASRWRRPTRRAFDPQALFGVGAFDRIFISYALSMIPPWREALARASRYLAPGRLAAYCRFRRSGRTPLGLSARR